MCVYLPIFQSKRVFLIHGGYHRIRKCLRQRGWVEQDYYKNSLLAKSNNEGGTSSPRKGAEAVAVSDDDSDGDDVDDGNDAGAVSDEEYSDEEEYCMLVSQPCHSMEAIHIKGLTVTSM